jgi:parallel beta-helix repeat protein
MIKKILGGCNFRIAKKIMAGLLLPIFVVQMSSLDLFLVQIARAEGEVEDSVLSEEKDDAEEEIETEEENEPEEIAEVDKKIEEADKATKTEEKNTADEAAPTEETQKSVTEESPSIAPKEPTATQEEPADNQEIGNSQSAVGSNVETVKDEKTEEKTEVKEPEWEKDGNKWTIEPVELDKTYKAPQNEDVTVIFTKLPENPKNLTIEEITLTDEQVAELGALSNKAYDITSNMKNGTFEYDLTLPKPNDVDEVVVKYAGNKDELAKAQIVEEVDIQEDKVEAKGLEHFTVFVVVDDGDSHFTADGWSTHNTGYEGDHKWITPTQVGKTAIWKFTGKPGTYAILPSWTIWNDHATNAHYTSSNIPGFNLENVNQKEPANANVTSTENGTWSGWYLNPERHNLKSNDTVNLTVETGTDGNLSADAMAFVNVDTIYVDDNWTGLIAGKDLGSEKIFGVNAFATIKEGVDAVSENGEVKVAEGTYTEGQVVINKNITLSGKSKTKSIIKPSVNTASPQGGLIEPGIASGWFVIASGKNVNIKQFTFDGTGKKIGIGVLSYGAGKVSGNNFKNIRSTQYKGFGIYLWNATTEILENTFSSIERVGIILKGSSSNATVSKNTYTGKGDGDWLDYGIELGSGAHAKVEDNEIRKNVGVAGDGSTSAGILVTTYYGSGTEALIIENEISDCEDGISVGYDGNDSSIVVAHKNNLSGNKNGANSTRPLVDATNNWWGDASGPEDKISGDGSILDTNPNGKGSIALGAIKYAPWYTDEEMTNLTSPNAVTEDATNITLNDATLNGKNGSYNATGHSFWVSLAPFSTTSPNIPSGVYSTPDFGVINANEDFSAFLSLVTTQGIHSNMPTITPGTTYYYVAWARVNGVWYPGEIKSFTTDPLLKPGVPVLTWPIDGISINDNTPLMQWDDSAKGTYDIAGYYYRVYYNCSNASNIPGSCSKLYPNETGVWRTISEYPAGKTSDGTFYWQVKAKDVNGNFSDWSGLEKLTIDTKAPNIPDLLAPGAGDTVKGNPTQSWSDVGAHHYIYESWKSQDTSNESNRIYPKPGDRPIEINGTSRTVSEKQTINIWWRVNAVDLAGNESGWSELRNLIIDNTPPVITLNGDAVVTVAQGSEYSDAGASCVDVFDGSCVVNVSSNVNTSLVGNYTVKYDAADSMGNAAIQVVRKVNVADQTAPVVSINSPLAGKVLRGTVDIYGSLEENVAMGNYNIAIYPGDADFMVFEKRIEQKNVDPASEITNQRIFQWNTKNGKYPDGEYLIRFAARDKAGNRALVGGQEYTGGDDSQHVIKVTVDNTVPEITNIAADKDYIKSGDVLTITAEVTDNSGVSAVSADFSYNPEYSNRPSPTSVAMKKVSDSTYQVAYTIPAAWNEGAMYIKVAARDLTGDNWIRSAGFDTVTIDNTEPMTDNDVDEIWHSTDVTVNLACADASSGCANTYYTTDGSEPTTSSSIGSSFVLSDEGQYTIKYFSVDSVGNVETVKTAENQVKIDKTLPSSVITSPEGDNNSKIYLNQWNGTLAGTANDALSGVQKVELKIKRTVSDVVDYWNGTGWQDGETLVLAAGTTSWTYGPLALPLVEGEYTIESHSTDNAGNTENTYTLTIVFDKTIPEVNLSISPSKPDGDDNWYVSTPSITLTANDANFDRIEYQIDSNSAEGWTIYSGAVKINDGKHIFYYRAWDAAENVSDEGIKNVKVDTEEPDEVDDIKAKYEKDKNAIRLSWDADDEDINQVYIYRGSKKNFDANSGSLISKNDDNDTSLLDDKVEIGKKYFYKFVSRDKAGNKSGKKTVSIKISEEGGGVEAVVTDEGVEANEGNQNTEQGAVAGAEENGNQNRIEENQEQGSIAGDETEAGKNRIWPYLVALAFAILLGLWLWKRRKNNQTNSIN